MANSVAVQDKAGALVRNLEASFATALPNHVTKEHFARALLTQIKRTPKLMQCTSDSIGASVVTCAQLGLMLGVNGAAWLIPFENKKKHIFECVLMIGYQGMIDLCYRTDRLESISADVVCANDHFEYEQGLDQKLVHRPCLTGPRGKAYAVYAIANIKGSSRPVYVVMNEEEVLVVKAASPGARKSDSPWNGNFEYEMWKKTAIRRLTKLLPKSVELNRALEFENQQAERLKEATATVIEDDPLAPGRHTRKKKSEPAKQPEAATQSDPTEPVSVDLAYIRGAESVGFEAEVKECLQAIGFSSLGEIENRPEQLAEVAKSLKEMLPE